MYICMYMSVYIYLYIIYNMMVCHISHTPMYMYIHMMCVHTYVHHIYFLRENTAGRGHPLSPSIFIHIHTQTYRDNYTYIYKHTLYIHIYKLVCIHAYSAYIYTYTYIHKDVDTCMHAYFLWARVSGVSSSRSCDIYISSSSWYSSCRCMYVRMYVCMYVCMYVSMYEQSICVYHVCMYTCMYKSCMNDVW